MDIKMFDCLSARFVKILNPIHIMNFSSLLGGVESMGMAVL